MILQARLELADMAIARQRARRAAEAAGGEAPVQGVSTGVSTGTGSVGAGVGGVEGVTVESEKSPEALLEEEEAIKLEEKLIAKAKRKIEKDAIAEELKREEEGREKRRLEKIRDNEEAKKMKEEQAKQFEEFLLVKAARDVS